MVFSIKISPTVHLKLDHNRQISMFTGSSLSTKVWFISYLTAVNVLRKHLAFIFSANPESTRLDQHSDGISCVLCICCSYVHQDLQRSSQDLLPGSAVVSDHSECSHHWCLFQLFCLWVEQPSLLASHSCCCSSRITANAFCSKCIFGSIFS